MEADARAREHERLQLLLDHREVGAQPRHHRLDLRARLLHRPSVGQASLHEEPAVPAPVDARRAGIVFSLALDALEAQPLDHRRRDPELRLEAGHDAGEPLRADADHGPAGPAHLDRLAEDVGPAAETALPQRVAQHDHRVLSLADVLVLAEAAAERRLQAEHREVVGRDRLAGGERRRAARREDAARERVRHQPPRERVGSVPQRQVVGIRGGEVGEVLVLAGVDLDQTVGIGDRRVRAAGPRSRR